MALADLIKAFSLSESSLRSSSPSTTTQVVGLLSVLAISGSVALFTLGSRLRATTDASEPLKLEESSSAGRDAMEPLEMDGGNGRLMRGRQEASGSSNLNLNRSDRRQNGKAASRKCVRFADDVLEPRGNGQEYRMRCAQEQRQQEEGKKRQPVSSSIPANRMALYKGIRQHRLQHSTSFFS